MICSQCSQTINTHGSRQRAHYFFSSENGAKLYYAKAFLVLALTSALRAYTGMHVACFTLLQVFYPAMSVKYQNQKENRVGTPNHPHYSMGPHPKRHANGNHM